MLTCSIYQIMEHFTLACLVAVALILIMPMVICELHTLTHPDCKTNHTCSYVEAVVLSLVYFLLLVPRSLLNRCSLVMHELLS